MTARIVVVDPEAPDPAAIEEAARVIKGGGLVAFPTETVYGLGANALDASAVARIFDAKGRPPTDPLIVHLAHIGQLGRYAANVPPVARALGLAFWAGPLTLIVRKQPVISDAVTSGLPTMAVRVPAHRVARALMEMAGVPIAAPSANRFARPSPTRAAHVVADLGDRVDLVLDAGPTPIGVESTIVDVTVDPPVVRRPGGISLEQLRVHVPDIEVAGGASAASAPQLAPGQLVTHYAPVAPLTVYFGPPVAVVARVGHDVRRACAAGERVGILASEEDLSLLAPAIAAIASAGRIVTRPLGTRADVDRAARDLFEALRALDGESPDRIVAIAPGEAGVGLAIVDRLTRAASGRVVRVRQ